MATITIDSVTKEYANGYVAVKGVNLDIEDGEFLVLVGPSGCGKSTLLRMVAGLEDITEGEVRIGGRVVNDEDPKDRDIAMVFQNYALYPHMTVRKNISYALRLAKVPKAEINKRVDEAARVLELEPVLDSKPGQLSGGQRQRVAMGRAIVRQPAAFLMDEPLSNLDAKLRVQMRAEIARLQHELGVTTIYVTHDQVEAMTMGTRVAVLKDGFIQQVDPPQSLYDNPVNLFVAAFIGSPSMNLYRARLDREGSGAVVRLGPNDIRIPKDSVTAHAGLADYLDGEVVIGIRPEALYDPALQTDVVDGPTLAATVELVEALGADLLVHTSIEATVAEVDDPDLEGAAPLSADLEHPGRVPCLARFNPRSEVRLADTTRLGVDPTQLHFFDPETGTRIQGPS